MRFNQDQPLLPAISLTVSDLTRYLRQLMESDEVLQDVWVMGELSNLSRPASGHIYFTLKDELAALRCVIWKSTALKLKLALQNGAAVEAHGYISLYERDGQYQLYIDSLRMAGEGWLFQEFLRLKARLEAEGLFDLERKRSLPVRPRKIGIVTSGTGAALQDMLNTLRQRYPLVEVVLAAVAVQGDSAPLEIVAALAALNRLEQPDLIIVARGGGSLEDLWAFNDERVVRAIVASEAPVITGIGHETDFTLADFAADLRAPTPTGAAVQATPEISDLRAGLRDEILHLSQVFQSALNTLRGGLDASRQRLLRASPLWQVQNDRQRLDGLSERSLRALIHHLELQRARLEGQASRLASLSPTAVLQRGFAVVRHEAGDIIHSALEVSRGSKIQVEMVDGQFPARVEADPQPGDRRRSI